MLIVSDPKFPHAPATITTDKINYPDGITPPMRAVRIKRFRKRVSKKVIEDVEKEVERLLQADLEAEDVKFEITEQKELELEEELSNLDETEEPTEMAEDDEFAAEIEEALYADAAESSEEESEEEDEDSQEEEAADEEEEDDGVDGQLKEHVALLKEEISDIMRKIDEKKHILSSQVNPIIKKRFEDIVSRLECELDLKKEQLKIANLEIQDQGEDREDATQDQTQD
jgi:transcription initiation factor TFIID subunit 7